MKAVRRARLLTPSEGPNRLKHDKPNDGIPCPLTSFSLTRPLDYIPEATHHGLVSYLVTLSSLTYFWGCSPKPSHQNIKDQQSKNSHLSILINQPIQNLPTNPRSLKHRSPLFLF